MNPYFALLQELLPELAAYTQSTPTYSAADFATWLHERTAATPATAELLPQVPAFLNRLTPLTQLGPLVSRVHYFAQQRAQQLLAGLPPITGLRDFVVLAAITNNQLPTKSEVAAMCLLELSTITEITQRLAKAELIQEVPDAHDRRTRRLRASLAGQDMLREASTRLEQLHPYIYAPLRVGEQEELRRLLGKVNARLTAEWLQRASQ